MPHPPGHQDCTDIRHDDGGLRHSPALPDMARVIEDTGLKPEWKRDRHCERSFSAPRRPGQQNEEEEEKNRDQLLGQEHRCQWSITNEILEAEDEVRPNRRERSDTNHPKEVIPRLEPELRARLALPAYFVVVC